MNKEGLLLNFMLIYLMVNKHNKEIFRNIKSKSDFPDEVGFEVFTLYRNDITEFFPQ